MPPQNPCLRCGACCAMYKVSFDNCEMDNLQGGLIPFQLAVALNATRSVMKGTEKRPIRCQALNGEIGRSVLCTIYEQRPTNCRAFFASGENNRSNSLCDQARAAYGLMPLSSF